MNIWADEWMNFDVGNRTILSGWLEKATAVRGMMAKLRRRLPPRNRLHHVHRQRPQHRDQRHQVEEGGQRRLRGVGAQPPRHPHHAAQRRRVTRLEAAGRQIPHIRPGEASRRQDSPGAGERRQLRQRLPCRPEGGSRRRPRATGASSSSTPRRQSARSRSITSGTAPTTSPGHPTST